MLLILSKILKKYKNISVFKRFSYFSLFLLIIIVLPGFIEKSDWGFYGHKKINRMAVFTLPPEMMYFFKKNIEFFTDHAPDPDKRKYIDPHEAIKHYIDIDYWGEYPFYDLPRRWTDVMIKYVEIYAIDGDEKALLFGPKVNEIKNDTIFGNNFQCPFPTYKSFIKKYVAGKILDQDIDLPLDSVASRLNIDLSIYSDSKIHIEEHFSQEGIVPYHLYHYYFALVNAFEERNPKKILRRANDIGHYIADAHVPLHTTKNYNGQLTNQIGIHAFWENRIPELLGDTEFDYLVGKAEYIENVRDFFWSIVLKSHSLKDKVLEAEKRVSNSFPDNEKYEFIERNGIITRVQSEKYTRAFNKEMNGMVEMRMRDAIKALGDTWYTAWIDAGQPELKNLEDIQWTKEELEQIKKLKNAEKNGHLMGRDHWD